MNYDILNAADHVSRNQACPLFVRDQLMMVFHAKSLSKRIQALGDKVDIEFFRLFYDKHQDVYYRDVAVCRNEKRYIIARTSIPSKAYRLFEQRFSIANQFPLGYFLFFGQGNVRKHFQVDLSHTPPSWFLEDFPNVKFVMIRRSQWQIHQNDYLELEEVFL